MNTWGDYIEAARKTSVYPREHILTYPMLGIVGEIGELLDAPKENQLDEMGDVLWYVAALQYDIGYVGHKHWISLVTFETAQDSIVSTNSVDFVPLMSIVFPLCEAVKKYCRNPTEERYNNVVELINALFVYLVRYIVLICKSTLRKVCEMNVAKLQARKEAGVLA